MSQLALITFLGGSGQVDPGYGVPAPPARPDNSLPPGTINLPVFPWDPTIDNSLPSGRPERPDNSLPGAPARPDNSLPGSGARPSNELPSPGRRYIVKWLACYGLILVPDNSLPETAEPK